MSELTVCRQLRGAAALIRSVIRILATDTS
jgi:hypothetical protein